MSQAPASSGPIRTLPKQPGIPSFLNGYHGVATWWANRRKPSDVMPDCAKAVILSLMDLTLASQPCPDADRKREFMEAQGLLEPQGLRVLQDHWPGVRSSRQLQCGSRPSDRTDFGLNSLRNIVYSAFSWSDKSSLLKDFATTQNRCINDRARNLHIASEPALCSRYHSINYKSVLTSFRAGSAKGWLSFAQCRSLGLSRMAAFPA